MIMEAMKKHQQKDEQGEEASRREKEQFDVADFIEDLDQYYSTLPSGISSYSDSSMIESYSQIISYKSDENSSAVPSFSLGDVDSFLKEDTNSTQTLVASINTNEDDDIAEELSNLNVLEKKLAMELEMAENTPTPERKR